MNKKKVGEVPSQLETNLEGPYLTHNFNDPLIFSEQSNITLEDDWITKQQCTIMETHSIEIDRPNWWDEPLRSSSYLNYNPFSSVLESLTTFDGMKKEIEDMIELIEDP